MTEILENYRETHEAIYRYKGAIKRKEVGEFLVDVGSSLKGDSPIEITKLLPQIPFAEKGSPKRKKITNTRINPTDDLNLKFLYAKENHKLELHMELEWIPE